MCNCGRSKNCQSAFNEFEAKYTSFIQLFLTLRGKSLKDKGKKKKSNINSCERYFEKKEKKKEKEKKDHTSSIEKYLEDKLIGKKKDQSHTSLEVHLFYGEMLPLPINRQNNHNGKTYLIMRCVFFF